VVFDEQGRRIGGARLLAVVTLKPGEQGRHYRLPTERDYEAARRAQERLRAILGEWEQLKKAGPLPAGRQVCPVPDEPTPAGGGSGAVRAFSVQRYGMFQWGDLFTARQKVALVTLARLARERPAADDEAVRAAMAFAISKQSDFNSTLSRWANHMEKSVATFGRQALPML
jgi:adenine-specific DNA methylase